MGGLDQGLTTAWDLAYARVWLYYTQVYGKFKRNPCERRYHLEWVPVALWEEYAIMATCTKQ